ncbi:oxidoreductase-like domain-containing protein [Rhodanobacter aciditrophus]|uniref:oxidoreductase-like domain-containing protein n=1 Tax=Rhodanobacter aciditrophus TaxID=1623218 RepID=UPI003CF0A6F6
MSPADPPADLAGDPRPQPPPEPDPADCCGEGCVPCVYDIYEQALERYKAALAAWQERHPDA